MIGARRRGQPLAVLAILLGGWICTRILLWQSPFPLSPALVAAAAARVAEAPMFVERMGADAPAFAEPRGAPAHSHAATYRRPVTPSTVAEPSVNLPLRTAASSGLVLIGNRSGLVENPAPTSRPVLAARPDGPRLDPAVGASRIASPRWTGDSWLMVRSGSTSRLAAGPLVGRYGGSQAGAVVRYHLSSGRHRPALYARSSAALGSPAERELALGIAVRPLRAVPARAQLEMRARHTGGTVRLAPAASVVSEIAPLTLPFALEAESYLEAGYVGGRFATPFVGGQLRIDRPVARVGAAHVRVGAGAWGGAQEGAAALDVGPGVTVELPLGEMRARMALDYRLRVAGDAAPGSGPALTLATGF